MVIHTLIVHYGDSAVTERCLAALGQSGHDPAAIVVIDHGEKPFESRNQQITILRPRENTGYGAGINLGLGALSQLGGQDTDIVVAMNNDVEVALTTLSTLRSWLAENSEPCLAGPVAGQVNLFTGRATIRRSNYPLLMANPWQMPYLHGSFLVASFKVWLHLKGFPEQQFLYWEDVMVSARALALGISLKHVPGLAITHTSDTATTASPEQLYYLVRNGARYLERSTTAPWRAYWKTLNTGRSWYHRHVSGNKIAAEALRDAWSNKTGKKR